MDNNLTRVVILLDRSGSMEFIRKATINGLNEFVNGQKADPGQTKMTVVLFDSQSQDKIFDGIVHDFKPLTEDTYIPRGMTPLYDALGLEIDSLGKRLAATNEKYRPGKVVFVTITDGLENSSRIFNREQVAEKIKHQTEVYNWQFVYLGANQDAILTAKGLNMNVGLAANYNCNVQSVTDMFKYSSQNITRFKNSGQAGSLLYTKEQRDAILDQTVDQSDQNQ